MAHKKKPHQVSAQTISIDVINFNITDYSSFVVDENHRTQKQIEIQRESLILSRSVQLWLHIITAKTCGGCFN